MTFKYGLTLPSLGSHKLLRFESWIKAALPGVEYRLPPQAPVKTETLTIRLRSLDDRARLLSAFPATLP